MLRRRLWLRPWRERRFLSRNEKIEMLERYRESLRNELEGCEEALQELKRDS